MIFKVIYICILLEFILCSAPSSLIVREFLSYFARISIERGKLVERFFYTLRFPSRDRFHLMFVKPRLYFAVIYLARIALALLLITGLSSTSTQWRYIHCAV